MTKLTGTTSVAEAESGVGSGAKTGMPLGASGPSSNIDSGRPLGAVKMPSWATGIDSGTDS